VPTAKPLHYRNVTEGRVAYRAGLVRDQEDLMKAWSNAPGLLVKVFLDHPLSLNETYWQHQRRALHFGSSMIGAGVACVVHALVPALFARTASMTVQSLHDEMHATGRLGGALRRGGQGPLERETLGGWSSTPQLRGGSQAS
jgi:Family of unknown function (DUF6356)